MNGWRQSMYVVTFGLSLVLAMATVLFALVGLNPKSVDYGSMPWVYSAIGDRVRAAGCRPSAGRAVVPKWRKLLIVASAASRSLIPSASTPVRTPTTIWLYDRSTGYSPATTVESSEPFLPNGRQT